MLNVYPILNAWYIYILNPKKKKENPGFPVSNSKCMKLEVATLS